jgi:hypothetical protein
MTYMDKALGSRIVPRDIGAGEVREGREALVVVVEDGVSLSESFRMICECLGITLERIASLDDLGPVLRNRRPMAVVAAMDAMGQDGCHVLMTVAAHDRSLPVLLMTGAGSRPARSSGRGGATLGACFGRKMAATVRRRADGRLPVPRRAERRLYPPYVSLTALHCPQL